jgi:hypothetical protein
MAYIHSDDSKLVYSAQYFTVQYSSSNTAQRTAATLLAAVAWSMRKHYDSACPKLLSGMIDGRTRGCSAVSL